MDYHSVLDFSTSAVFSLLAIAPAGTTVLLILGALLSGISFFISGAEVAFFSLNNKDINRLKTLQHPSYRRIVSLLEQPKIVLASMLITNSLVNICIILISNILINDWIGGLHVGFWIGFLIKVVAVTFLILLFCEVLPKVWATYDKIRFAATSSLIVDIFNSLFYNISKRMVKMSDGIEKKFSVQTNAVLDSSRLDHAIDLLPEHEATVEEKQILKGIRKFGDTTVK
ncbi:MAG: CNNM domain-containing protein, partial [Ferruginibacter sp.]